VGFVTELMDAGIEHEAKFSQHRYNFISPFVLDIIVSISVGSRPWHCFHLEQREGGHLFEHGVSELKWKEKI